ncbi:hypothetical protein RFI_36581 [Reticulomyxa filosa]|uniref:Transmembrane protein n=1 Tax=Reticulomyxa filosa TaxID=46433 RepID=X6LHP5_RETFI|nr:hypothetical protein RFI_36581 [Reticulomyxa filosa]|eukprot:ETO00861.1 hypothetical protein RFI_36581 [Reticulomyxa filosa]
MEKKVQIADYILYIYTLFKYQNIIIFIKRIYTIISSQRNSFLFLQKNLCFNIILNYCLVAFENDNVFFYIYKSMSYSINYIRSLIVKLAFKNIFVFFNNILIYLFIFLLKIINILLDFEIKRNEQKFVVYNFILLFYKRQLTLKENRIKDCFFKFGKKDLIFLIIVLLH